MAEERVQRRLAAILAADVVGYSRLMGMDEAGLSNIENTTISKVRKTVFTITSFFGLHSDTIVLIYSLSHKYNNPAPNLHPSNLG